MAYIVLKAFKDKTDNSKLYIKGKSYSHTDEDRIAFLIEKGYLKGEVKKESNEIKNEVKHVGGGYYELPNGERIKGKDNAKQALADLESGE